MGWGEGGGRVITGMKRGVETGVSSVVDNLRRSGERVSTEKRTVGKALHVHRRGPTKCTTGNEFGMKSWGGSGTYPAEATVELKQSRRGW
mmetsp:Transcript_16263/g.33003  ORF Transcript_16263/g.33003 Transcript_16263/m.33003 type:complete len:90 (+) Transcript_16263:1-270(+)